MSDKTVKKNRAASVQGSLYFQDRGGFNRVEKKKKKKKKNRSTFPEVIVVNFYNWIFHRQSMRGCVLRRVVSLRNQTSLNP